MVCGWQSPETKKTLRSGFERVAHGHGLGGGGGLIQQRGIGDVQPGQVADHRLEIQQRLQAALGDFRLIRRVLRVPAGIFQDVALNHRRGDAIVIAHADEGAETWFCEAIPFSSASASASLRAPGSMQRGG